ncbi:MAG: hypothetical protein ACRDUA_08145 [Micromonosporaceae bacterium]
MRVVSKLALFGLALAVLFAGGLGVGGAWSPASPAPGAGDSAKGAGRGGDEHGTEPEGKEFPKGVLVSDRGYRFAPERTELRPGGETEFRFRILDATGEPVTEYLPTHEKDLHLVVVRRDLTRFWHVHPTFGADGVWQIGLKVPEAGSYRAYADFQPKGQAESLTLGVDLAAPGGFAPRQVPGPAATATVDGYDVKLTGDLVTGRANPVTLSVSRGGVPVTDLEPYLGAYGHLVALRTGDLAYLHVHPEEGAEAGPGIGFAVEVPSPGRYRLFLDFKHDGVVRTAAFTVDVATGAAPDPEPGSESPESGGHGHGD